MLPKHVYHSPKTAQPNLLGIQKKPTKAIFLSISLILFVQFAFSSSIIEFDGGRILLEKPEHFACDNVTNGGEIAADEFGCPNPTWDPSLITSVTLPTGGSGTLEYIWILTTDNPMSPGAFWNPIIGSTAPEYDPAPISVTTYYRRCARRSGCTDYIAESNIIMKEAICCDNVTDGGVIAENQVLCDSPFVASILTNVVFPSGGTNTLEYQWAVSTTGSAYSPTNPDWTFINGATAPVYDPGVLSETSYFVRLSRRHGCYDYDGVSNIVEIIVNDGIAVSLDGMDEECLGAGNGEISILSISGGVPGYTYQWTGFPGETNLTLTGLSEGTYEVVVTDTVGCTGSAEFTLNAGPELSVNTVSTPVSCVGDTDGTARVTSVPNGVGPFLYQWNDPLMQDSMIAADLSPASYEVVVSDSRGCTGSATVEVDDADPLLLSTISTDATCGDSEDGTATAQVSGGVSPYTYLWSDTTGQTTSTAINLSMGTYSVTVTDANGCSIIGSETVGAPMQVTLQITTSDALCFGSNDGTAAVAIVNGDINNFNVIWNNGMTTPQITGLASGMYAVTVSDANGCTVEESGLVSEPTEMDLMMSADSASCFNSSDGTATVVVTGGTSFPNNIYQYEWSLPNSPNVPMLDDVSPDTYSVTVTDANGCTMSNSVQIGAPDELQITLTPTHVSCNGLTDGAGTASVVGGLAPYSYQWNDPSGSTQASISNLAPGAYSLSVTDANSCLSTAILNISEPAELTVSFNNVDVVCTDDTNGVGVVVPAGGTQPYSILWGTGQSTQAIFNLGVGSYDVTVTDANGCETASSTQIVATTTLNSSVTTFDATCFDVNNGVAIANGINGTLPYDFAWSNGETTAQINDLFFGNYTVTVTDGDGCSVVNTAVINSPLQLIANIQVLTQVLTYGGNEGSAQVFPSGGVSPYTFLWSNGSTTNTATDLEGGAHTVTITDANNCTSVGQITLIEPSKIGDYVWDDENQNGIQDPMEVGVEGINVFLTGVTNSGDSINLVTVTDTAGYYAFDGLRQGFYKLEFQTPPNNLLTYQNIGNDGLDSDPDPATGFTQSFPITQGEFESRWDCGLIILDEKIDIGDKVWYDQNHDGIQGLNEGGVEGILVRLRKMPANNIIAVDVTDLLGNYRFEDVLPGDYRVEFALASFPAGGYIVSPKDQGNDDTKDSDANVATGMTDQFTVFPFTLDNLTIDMGIFKECDNITDGGVIGYDEELCGVGADPSEIVNIITPSGGFGNIEYLWMKSTIPVYNGPGDVNWSNIPNSNSPNYNPGPISQSTYYIRCARREGCNDYIGESNVVAKVITSYPLAQIIDEPNFLCKNEEGRFEAAIAGAGATYFWEFSGGANPATASTRVVNPVQWATPGVKFVKLTVTRFNCSFSVNTEVVVDNCGNKPLVTISDFTAQMGNDQVELAWNVSGKTDKTIFYVQRSEDGQTFTTLGNLMGELNTESSAYSFIDNQPRFGENFYRILYQQLDSNNDMGYSEMAHVLFQREPTQLAQVYPNPTNGKVMVELLKPSDESAIGQVLTPFGKVLFEFEIPAKTEKYEIDLSDQFDGLYLVSIQQPKLKEQICKVIKTQ